MKQRIMSMISKCGTQTGVMPPTEIFREGWLLRCTLDWFESNPSVVHPLSVPKGTRWYSEALLHTQFRSRFRGDPVGEKHTHADGAIGHFSIGGTGKGDLLLFRDASVLVIVEAKINSLLSKGTTHAPYFDQAARNVACIAHILSRSRRSPDRFTRLGFYIAAPKNQIKRGKFKKYINKKSIDDKVNRRAKSFNDYDYLGWKEKWFDPTLSKIEIDTISWEEIVGFIRRVEMKTGNEFDDFYNNCLGFN